MRRRCHLAPPARNPDAANFMGRLFASAYSMRHNASQHRVPECRGEAPACRSAPAGGPKLVVSWDKADDRIWYGVWGDDQASIRLYLVAERLPDLSGWDWSVWQSNKPRILRRGFASSASEATAAAETAASHWLRIV
jgi:hypothetical protein